MFKKSSHCLLVEEETYNWASPNPGRSKYLVVLALLFMLTGILFSVLR